MGWSSSSAIRAKLLTPLVLSFLFNTADILSLCKADSPGEGLGVTLCDQPTEDCCETPIDLGAIAHFRKMDRRIHIAVDKLNADINTHLSVGALARLVNLSRWRFAHLFKKEMSVPVSHYVTNLRMQEAQRMLLETFLSIKEIRVHLGNIDRSHFNREFKRRTGLTPSEFRRRLGKSE